MINLEMLFWAAKNGGNPYLYDIAVSHADKTMKSQFVLIILLIMWLYMIQSQAI